MKCLITGSAGFVGRYLEKELLAQGWGVTGYNLRDGENLLDYETLRNKLDVLRPDRIYHLAAQAYVPESFANPRRVFEVNTMGSVNLLEAIRQLGLKTRVLLAGTSEEYGDTPSETISESSLPVPLSPYAISKLAMDQMGQLYSRAYKFPVIVTRAFNHAGPGRGEMYAESAFAKQIAEIEAGKREVLHHGNLDSIRNYTDVRDIVRAYVKAIELGPAVYNICSDNNISMRDLLEGLRDHATCHIDLEENPALFRPADFSFKPPTCEKFKKRTDWEPEIPFSQTLKDILDYWRVRV